MRYGLYGLRTLSPRSLRRLRPAKVVLRRSRCTVQPQPDLLRNGRSRPALVVQGPDLLMQGLPAGSALPARCWAGVGVSTCGGTGTATAPLGSRTGCWRIRVLTARRACSWGINTWSSVSEICSRWKRSATWVAAGALAARREHRLVNDRVQAPRPPDAAGATAPRSRPSDPGAGRPAGGAPDPRGWCHRCAVSAGRNRSPEHPGRGSGSDSFRSRRRRVFRLTTRSHWWPSCTRLYPRATPRAFSGGPAAGCAGPRERPPWQAFGEDTATAGTIGGKPLADAELKADAVMRPREVWPGCAHSHYGCAALGWHSGQDAVVCVERTCSVICAAGESTRHASRRSVLASGNK